MERWAVIAVGVLLLVAAKALFGRGPGPRPKQNLRRHPEDRFDLDELARRLGREPDFLRGFVPTYGRHTIAKRGPYRDGPGGRRTLHTPDPDAMAIQRAILHRILRDLRVHEAATGFERGSSVAKNAAAHAHQAVVIKLDLESFFERTGAERVRAYFRFIGWNAEAADVLTRLTTYEGGLPQGAPTSPALSNRVNFSLDATIAREALYCGATYTRYADDITLSLPYDRSATPRGLIQRVERIAKRHGYTVHRTKKRHVLRPHQRQEVTGLVVNDGPRLPRKTRRWLRAVEHRIRTGGAATLTAEQLAGWRAYESHVQDVQQEHADALRTAMAAALERNDGRIAFAASTQGVSRATFVRRMKRLGLWDEEKRMKPRTGPQGTSE
ncbi:MAG: reverse transcriptase domain-containing protein [Myxococcota bacterium]